MDKFKTYDSFDSGSNYKFGDKMNKPNNPRSLFDLSHTVITTMKNGGILQPITMFRCLPGDDHEISADALLRVLPQVVPPYTRQRLKLYAFYSRCSDLWNNWQVFMDKGYTGNVEKNIPFMTENNTHIGSESTVAITPDSLQDCLGLPIGASIDSLLDANISMLPFMMYLRIYRDYFMNKNEWINDRILLPDDDSRFRLDDDGNILSAKDLNKYAKVSFDTSDITYDSSGNMIYGLLYHEFADDYFTTALPFTQRGTTPTLDYTVDLSRVGIDFTDSVDNYASGNSYSYIGLEYQNGTNKLVAGTGNGNTGVIADNSKAENLLKTLNKAKLIGTNIGLEITLEDIRGLAVQQNILETLARTDGSYAQFGLSFFGEISKAAHDYRATFIGATYKNLAFTEVLQTAGSTVPTTEESGNSPLGAYAGHGITGMSNNYIGRIHCDDYGYIMIIACIMPDVLYSQGLDKLWTDSIQDQMYLPDRAKLGLQPIYNKELFYAGNNSTEEGGDDYLWAYQNPFDDYRYMQNKIKGKIADPTNRTFFPYSQSRKFTQLPNWGHSFSVASDNNVRKDYLFAPSEDAYTCQFQFNIRTVRELPYKPIPAKII